MSDNWQSLDNVLKNFVLGLENTAKALEKIVKSDQERIQNIAKTAEHLRKQQEKGKQWEAENHSG